MIRPFWEEVVVMPAPIKAVPLWLTFLSSGIIQSDFLESEDRDLGRLDGIFAMMGRPIFASIKSTEAGANVGLI